MPVKSLVHLAITGKPAPFAAEAGDRSCSASRLKHELLGLEQPKERGSFRPRQGGISRPAEAQEIVSRQAQKMDVPSCLLDHPRMSQDTRSMKIVFLRETTSRAASQKCSRS
jgi:hypothetical protein